MALRIASVHRQSCGFSKSISFGHWEIYQRNDKGLLSLIWMLTLPLQISKWRRELSDMEYHVSFYGKNDDWVKDTKLEDYVGTAVRIFSLISY